MRALLLCAGAGTRMRPLTYALPKPLVPVRGVPLAVRQIVALRRAGVTEIVVNAAHRANVLRAALGDGSAWGVKLFWSVEGQTVEEALETRGGIVRALGDLSPDGQTPFLVVAGDIVTNYDYAHLVRTGEKLTSERLAHLVLVANPDYHSMGDMRLEGDLVRRDAPTHTFSSLGVYHPALFKGVDDRCASLFPWLNDFCEAGRITGEVFDGWWRNVGDFRELSCADREAPACEGVWPRILS